jgi:RNA polymerase sigma factor (sigma-70 family)
MAHFCDYNQKTNKSSCFPGDSQKNIISLPDREKLVICESFEYDLMFVSYHKKADKSTLWERYVNGDRTSFGELYVYYHKSLTAFCLGRLKNIELAENAASETLIKLLQHPRPSEIESYENWLFTVAKNECNTIWSTADRRKKLLEKNYEVSNIHAAEADVAFSTENLDQIIQQNLDETDYKIWQLYQQGYDNKEVAEIMGLNEKTVANRKSTARAKLKIVLKNYHRKDMQTGDER